MACKCMAAKIAEEYAMYAGICKSVLTNFICKMCNSESKVYTTHYQDSDFTTNDYECAECHSYIRYIDDGVLYKEEYYLNDHYIINDNKQQFRYCTSVIKCIYLPAFEFKNKEHLITKLNKYLVF